MTSTPDSSLCNQKVKAFLEEYKKDETQSQFKGLAEAIGQKCEELLKSMKINGVVQSRSKGYDSLETKLNDITKTSEFIKWVAGIDNGSKVDVGLHLSDIFLKFAKEIDKKKMETKGVYEHPDIGDLAGVRVGLFFPGDVPKVAQAINEIFNVSYTFGTVTDTTRSAVDGRNGDIQRHGDGRISQGPGEDVQRWEHYGYKSWQVVVEWKRPLPKDIGSIEAALAPTKVFNPLRVEIQLGTVVTQAWAEVQHNIIYKRSIDIQATPTMKRMIDAINGLAITTDIMLMELERSQAQAEEEAEKQHRLEKDAPFDMLRIACLKGDHRAVTRLLADEVDANTKDDLGMTALHWASRKGHGNAKSLDFCPFRRGPHVTYRLGVVRSVEP
jgi:ppGpp synthetase/RelA/SpoT-type nucleotidyltranferase